MSPVPILLDCDPGHDDVVAILLAAGSPAIDLRAITTVGGNGDLEQVTRNALRICALAGIEVPIAAGCAGPLLGAALQTAPEVHGESGLDGVELPEPDRAVAEAHAVDVLAAHLRAADAPLTLVATGPLTNVALLLRRDPAAAAAIGEIVLMGGTIGEGNRRPLAEFNIFVDPEAAHIVFSSGLPVTMCGLNVTHQALATDDVLARLTALGTPVARTVVGLLTFYAGRYRELFGFPAAPVHDPVAVARVIAPEVVGCIEANVVVELAGEHTRGATVVDRHGVTGRPANARVARTLDAPAFWDLVHDAIAALPARE